MSTDDESALPPFVPDEECPFHWGPSDNFGDCTCLSTAHLVRHAAISLHKAQLAIKLLYKAHSQVAFDTPEDEELQQRVLQQARECLGYDPAVDP